MITGKKFSIVFLAAVFLLLQAGAAMAQTVWTKYGNKPVLEVGLAGAWDSKYIEPGSVVFDNTTYHLWYAASDGTFWKIGYATSPDGIVWTKYPDPVLDAAPAGAWDDYSVYGPSVIYDGSKYHMWYTGLGAVHQIGHATSDNGTAWTKDSANPVIELGVGALIWDGGGAYCPSVIYTAGQYKMWYTGYCSKDGGTVGYAESADGTVWTKHAGNPLLVPGEKGAWDDVNIIHPHVIFDGSTYHLWYGAWHKDFKLLNKGFYKIGYAASTDGLTWQKSDANPVLKQGRRLFSGWDGRGVDYPVVILDNGQFKMWFAGQGGWGKAYHEQIGYATSPADGQ